MMRAIQIIQKYFEADDEHFLIGLYRELLNREPDRDGFSYYMSFLKNNGTKIDVFREVVKSSEFGTLLSQAKLIHVLQNIISRSDYNFVKQLYHNIWGTAPNYPSSK